MPDTPDTTSPYQVMPPLPADEYAALETDIHTHGVLVPVTVDQHGNILDGHHRAEIADRLGVKYDRLVRYCDSDDEARDVAFALNIARRHLTREQKRALLTEELTRRPGDSDRAIARRLGLDHKTVGAARRELRGEIPHPPHAATSERLAIPGDDAAVARLTADAIVRAHDAATTDQERADWAHAIQLTDEILAWGEDTTRPNLFWFGLVAQSLYCAETSFDVWELLAAWLVPVAQLALQECQELHARRNSDRPLPGEDLARLTVALWGSNADREMRRIMLDAMEDRVAMAVVRAAEWFPIPARRTEVHA